MKESSITKIKYEMKHNLEHFSQSVKVSKEDLDNLIEMAESNQAVICRDLSNQLVLTQFELLRKDKEIKDLENKVKNLMTVVANSK